MIESYVKSFCLFKYWEGLKLKKTFFSNWEAIRKKNRRKTGTQKNTSVASSESQISVTSLGINRCSVYLPLSE